MRTLRTIVDGVPSWVGTTLFRPNQPGNSADVYWNGSDYSSSFTQYTGSGGQTITEQGGLLSIRQTSANSGSNIAAALTPRSLSVGDAFVVPVRTMVDEDDTLFCGVMLTDGTASGSNAVATTIQHAGNESYLRTYLRWGTVGSFTSVNTPEALPSDIPLMLGIEYDASNSFKMWLSPDGLSWTALGRAAQTVTMTPTHVGLCWYSEGGDSVFTFGPIAKMTGMP